MRIMWAGAVLLMLALATASADRAVAQQSSQDRDGYDSLELLGVIFLPAPSIGPAVLWSHGVGRFEIPVVSAGVVLFPGLGAAPFADVGANVRLVGEWYVGFGGSTVRWGSHQNVTSVVLRTGLVGPAGGRFELGWEPRLQYLRARFTLVQFQGR